MNYNQLPIAPIVIEVMGSIEVVLQFVVCGKYFKTSGCFGVF